MRITAGRIITLPMVLCLALLFAQDSPKATTPTTVPRLVRFTGIFHAANNLPVGSTEGVTFAIYRDEQGGNPLWQETQNVRIDADGHYSAMLGITQNDGVPVELFSSTEPRWLGAQFNRPGETEQPRVQLVSVPYALKASDADTLGGLPASAYLRTPSGERPRMAAGESNGGTASSASDSKAPSPKAIVGTPSPNSLVKFINAAGDFSNSIVVDNGSNVGIGTVSPSSPLTVVGNGVSPLGTANFFRSDLGGRFSHIQLGSTGDWYVRSSLSSGRVILQDTGGNVGIGTGSPNGSLTVVGNGAAPLGTANFYRSDLAGSQSHIQYGTSGNWYVRSSLSSGRVILQDTGGNVGIGTGTPTSKLDVAGDINFTGSIRFQGSQMLQVPGGLINRNLAVGPALNANTTGSNNTAIGFGALIENTFGYNNTAIGDIALFDNTMGAVNTAIGVGALQGNFTGNNNIAIGAGAAANVGLSNNIHIGHDGFAADSGTIRIGDSVFQTSFFAAGIRGVMTATNDAIPVVVDSAGQLGTVSSSRRYKEDIQDMGDASSGLMRLRPVTFRYKQPFADGSKPVQYGLIAEEVEQVYPDLVAHSADGQVQSLKYQILDSMLLNEVQKQQAEIAAQRAKIAAQQSDMTKEHEQILALQAEIEELKAVLASLAQRQPR
jgi:hypothetical protein